GGLRPAPEPPGPSPRVLLEATGGALVLLAARERRRVRRRAERARRLDLAAGREEEVGEDRVRRRTHAARPGEGRTAPLDRVEDRPPPRRANCGLDRDVP